MCSGSEEGSYLRLIDLLSPGDDSVVERLVVEVD